MYVPLYALLNILNVKITGTKAQLTDKLAFATFYQIWECHLQKRAWMNTKGKLRLLCSFADAISGPKDYFSFIYPSIHQPLVEYLLHANLPLDAE